MRVTLYSKKWLNVQPKQNLWRDELSGFSLPAFIFSPKHWVFTLCLVQYSIAAKLNVETIAAAKKATA
jgi:hypothetical protein